MASSPLSVTANIARKEFLSGQAREFLTSRTHCLNFPSLQQLTATCLWLNKHLLIDRWESDQTNPFDRIPNSLKNYLHSKFSDYTSLINIEEKAAMQSSIQSTYLLHNKELTIFTVPKYFLAEKSDSDFSTYFWKSLLLECPNLHEFYCPIYHTACIYEQAAFINSLMSMKNLQIVKLEGINCDDSHLCTMAEQMPNLSVLEMVLNEITSGKGFEAMSKLQLLGEFIFFAEVDTLNVSTQILRNKTNRQNFQLCIQNLPKLRVAGERFNHYLPIALKNIGLATERELQSGKTMTLGLQEVTLLNALSISPGILLPNLTFLHLIDPQQTGFLWDSRLSSVTELGLYEVKMDTSVQILSQAGRRIKKLFLYVKDDTIIVDTIFNLCPSLERFSVVLSPKRINLMSSIKPDTLRHLQVLELLMLLDSPEEFLVEPAALMQLLEAPELRHLELTKITLQQRETEEIVSRLQRREILQKLEHVILQPWHATSSANYEVANSRSELVLSSMVLYCPNLTQVFNFANSFFRD